MDDHDEMDDHDDRDLDRRKMATTMREFKRGRLRSGSRRGPRVRSRRQAIGIGLNQARRAATRRRRRA